MIPSNYDRLKKRQHRIDFIMRWSDLQVAIKSLEDG